MFKKAKAFYSNLRIKYKMFLLISFVLFAFSFGGLAVLQYAFNVYNKEIYRQSAQSLSVSSHSIENELKKMERLSYKITTDQYVQSYLGRLKESDTEYERFIIGMELRRRLLEIGGLDKHVNSLQVYDTLDNEYATGNKMKMLQEKRLAFIKSKVSAGKGRVQWIFPDDTDQSLIAAREVRSYLPFSLERIGMVAVRVNLEEIVSSFSGSLNEKGSRLVILNKGEQVYPVNTTLPTEYMKATIKDDKGYKLIKSDGKRYFITYSPAQHTKWTYMIVTPYNSLFEAVSSVKKAVLIVYTVLFLLVMFMGMRFTGGITGPIESLNRKMKRIQKGKLDGLAEEELVELPRDESGQMHDNFEKMMNQINELITENYKKQIVIKDSEFKTLQAQINPHFLYNTLESINWAAKMEGNQQISRMAESLGYILRSSINMKESLITLEQELKIVENYITIQSYRFEERLVFDTDIPSDMLHCKVPKFILQPLVENAIRYGLERMIGTCTIRIYGGVADEQLRLTIQDDGPGMDKQLLGQLKTGDYQPKGTGIGLKNIDERIQIIFGKQYGIEVESEKYQGTKVSIILPFQEGRSDNVQGITGR